MREWAHFRGLDLAHMFCLYMIGPRQEQNAVEKRVQPLTMNPVLGIRLDVRSLTCARAPPQAPVMDPLDSKRWSPFSTAETSRRKMLLEQL
jgi:hypothetical protein